MYNCSYIIYVIYDSLITVSYNHTYRYKHTESHIQTYAYPITGDIAVCFHCFLQRMAYYLPLCHFNNIWTLFDFSNRKLVFCLGKTGKIGSQGGCTLGNQLHLSAFMCN